MKHNTTHAEINRSVVCSNSFNSQVKRQVPHKDELVVDAMGPGGTEVANYSSTPMRKPNQFFLEESESL